MSTIPFQDGRRTSSGASFHTNSSQYYPMHKVPRLEGRPFYAGKDYIFPPPLQSPQQQHSKQLLVPSHYMLPLKIEPEPTVEALDLRICKQNESISQYDFSKDILGEENHQLLLEEPQPKRSPSPLPPPSSLAVSMSFNQPFYDPFHFRPPPMRHDFLQGPSYPQIPSVSKNPSHFPPETQLLSLRSLEGMKMIGAPNQCFREKVSLKRGRDEKNFLDSRLRRIEEISAETKNLIVLPSRSETISPLLRSSSPNKSLLSHSVVSNSSHVRLKRRYSTEWKCRPPGLVASSTSSMKQAIIEPSTPLSCSSLSQNPSSVYINKDRKSPSRIVSENEIEVEDHTLNDKTKRYRGKRGRPRKHKTKVPLPPLYVFIRNLIHNDAYNPRVLSWVNESKGIFKVNQTAEYAQTWGKMKRNRSEEMNYEKMSRAMRYHYGSEKQGRKGHLAMVKEKRLVYQFGELAVNWKSHEIPKIKCDQHMLCKGSFCLWSKE
ncbi:uncharacterized protein [Lepeophtheirus salmonis]|uniref:uncharacterized protein n=1 Tax=Lepeophtheirus salmonis TaxID=72036 RepID=UPI001AE5A5D7|nr:uncharacterized protein LOC121129271 [Lepeophtheirus salmonis]